MAVQRRAFVQLPGDVANDDVINAVVRHQLVPFLPEGIRELGAGEQAELVDVGGGRWFVTDLSSKQPVFDAVHIAPGSVQQESLGFPLPSGSGTSVLISATAPPSPNQGDLWIDSSADNVLKEWDAATSSWKVFQFGPGAVSFTASGTKVTFGPTAPASPGVDDVWYDTSNGARANVWDGTGWNAFQFGTGAIAAGSVTAALIAANTITAMQIAANAVVAAKIAAGTITGDKLAANTVTAAQIAANTITAAKIAANTITATQLAAGTITATELAAGSVTSAKIAAGAVTADSLAVGAIDATSGDFVSLSAGTFQGQVVNSELSDSTCASPTAPDLPTQSGGSDKRRVGVMFRFSSEGEG